MSQSASNSFFAILSRPPHQRRDHDSRHQYCDHDFLGVEKVTFSQSASKCSGGQPEEKKSSEYYQFKGDDHHDHDHHKYCDHYDNCDDDNCLTLVIVK